MILNIHNFRIVSFKVGLHENLRYRIQKKRWLLFWHNLAVDGLFTDYDTAEDAAAAILKHADQVILTIAFTPTAKVLPSPQDRFETSFKNEQGPWGGIFNG